MKEQSKPWSHNTAHQIHRVFRLGFEQRQH